MSESSSVVTALSTPTASELLRFTERCLGHDATTSEHFVHHVMDAQPGAAVTDSERSAAQRWTRLARGCREYLEPLEATHWWAAARAAEHACADPNFTVDPSAVRSRLASARPVAEVLAVMPAVDRIALLLHDGQGFTIDEVADVMRSSQDAARDRVRRARLTMICALDPSATSDTQPPVDPPGEGDCAASRWALAAAGHDELRRRMKYDDHVSSCDGCLALSSALAETVGHLEK